MSTRLPLGLQLCAAGKFGNALPDIGKIVLGSREIKSLARAVLAPVAAIACGTERGQFHGAIHGFEQCAIMADDDRTAPPICEKAGHSFTAFGTKIVGRFVQYKKIGPGEDERCMTGPRALAA